MALPLQFLLETVLPQLLMGKDKKKKSKKDKVSANLMDVAAASLKKFRKVTKQIGKLSTGQKMVGGLALAAAGLTYLANRDSALDEKAPSRSPDAMEGSDVTETLADKAPDEDEVAPVRKSRKSRKSK